MGGLVRAMGGYVNLLYHKNKMSTKKPLEQVVLVIEDNPTILDYPLSLRYLLQVQIPARPDFRRLNSKFSTWGKDRRYECKAEGRRFFISKEYSNN